MNKTQINDPRVEKDFANKTFSKYKLCEVKKQMMKTLKEGKIEESCYWSAEMICSGHFGDVWEIMIEFFAKNIYRENPKLSIYLSRRVIEFVNKIKEEEKISTDGSVINLRNDIWIREMFGESICLLCDSNKALEMQDIVIRQDMLNLDNIPHRLKAPNFGYSMQIMKEGEHQCAEFFVSMNELIYHLSDESKNMYSCCFWLDWILTFAVSQKKEKEKKLKCHPRLIPNVKPLFHKEFIWVIWEVVMKFAVKISNPFIIELVSSLLCLFTVKYEGWKKTAIKRKSLLKFAFLLLTEDISPLMSRILCNESTKDKTNQVKQNLFKIYAKIKKNEFSGVISENKEEIEKENQNNKSFLHLLVSSSMSKLNSTKNTKIKDEFEIENKVENMKQQKKETSKHEKIDKKKNEIHLIENIQIKEEEQKEIDFAQKKNKKIKYESFHLTEDAKHVLFKNISQTFLPRVNNSDNLKTSNKREKKINIVELSTCENVKNISETDADNDILFSDQDEDDYEDESENEDKSETEDESENEDKYENKEQDENEEDEEKNEDENENDDENDDEDEDED